jgi:hypothetical protein
MPVLDVQSSAIQCQLRLGMVRSFGGLHRRDHAFQDKSEGIDGYESLDSGCTGDQSVRPAMLRISSGILGFILGCLESVLLRHTLQIFRTFTNHSSHRYVNPLGFQHLNPNWKFYTTYTVSFGIFIRISFDAGLL